MGWPWRRFEAMFTRHLFRKAREQATAQKDLMIAAINANMNYDGKDALEAKQERIKAIHDSWADIMESLQVGAEPISQQEQQAIDQVYEEDPLFRGARAMRTEAQQGVTLPEAGMGQKLLG